jgi:glutamate-ammonia-ligase adenylyltransferase
MAHILGKDPYVLALETSRAYLAQYTDEGYLFRVDFRLRPYGQEGQLVHTLEKLLTYFQERAALPEIQALLKMRPVAGNLHLGYAFLDRVRPLLTQKRDTADIVQALEKSRKQAMRSGGRLKPELDIKSGLGGLRDIEFMTQGLQLIHAHQYPELIQGNTLRALELLGRAGVLEQAQVQKLQEDYIFLRRVEHYLQILEDRQIHALPKAEAELSALAKRMSGSHGTAEAFSEDIDLRLQRVHTAYTQFLEKYSE